MKYTIYTQGPIFRKATQAQVVSCVFTGLRGIVTNGRGRWARVEQRDGGTVVTVLLKGGSAVTSTLIYPALSERSADTLHRRLNGDN